MSLFDKNGKVRKSNLNFSWIIIIYIIKVYDLFSKSKSIWSFSFKKTYWWPCTFHDDGNILRINHFIVLQLAFEYMDNNPGLAG